MAHQWYTAKRVPTLIGIDYGTKRVGVAVSDTRGTVAFPRMTLPNDRMLMSSLKEFIAKEGADEVVIGESTGPTGDNPVMKHTRAFAQELERETGVTIRWEPEYLSSAEARRTSTANLVDAEAAAIILNSYLNHTHGSR